MDPVPDPLLLRKSGSAGDRTREYSWGRLDDYGIVIRRRVSLTSVGYVETFLVETVPSTLGGMELCGILWRLSFG